MSNKVYLFLGLFLLAGVAFQNCSPVGGSASSSQNVNNSNSSFGSTADGSRYVASDNTSGAGSIGGIQNLGSATTASSLKVNNYATPAAQTDCSSPDAIISQDVQNSDANITVCAQFELDMPASSHRYGQKYYCDSPEKFVRPPGSWVYDSANRRWLIPTEKLTNHAYLVPGKFWTVIKDAQGNVILSNPIVIKRTNNENCLVAAASGSSSSGGGSGSSSGSSGGSSGSSSGSSSTPTRTCRWSGGIVIGPTPNYAIAHNRSCVVGNETYSYDDGNNSYNYQCVCQ